MSNNTLKENIDWVGFVDWNVRDFHGYNTSRGSTYNSYLIRDEKNVVIDSVKAPYAQYLLDNISALCPLEKIDYVICNHAEPDHSGSLPKLMEACVNAKLVCNKKCKETLELHYNTEGWNWQVVDESSTLELGKRNLKFMNTPMAHWPESMFTYCPEEKLLFSMDAFGQHYASSCRFDDEVPFEEIMLEAKVYYANIIMHLGKQVEKILGRATQLDIEMIAPSHGVIWRKNLGEIISRYMEWMKCQAKPKVLIFYDTMWKSTGQMAEAIMKGANIPGVDVKFYDVKSTNITVLATEAIDAACIAVGSPTLNMTLMPKVAEALTYLKGLSPKGKAGMAFGSYGWAKKAGPHHVLECLKDMNIEILVEEPIQSKFVPGEEVLAQCEEAGRVLAAHALKVGQK